MCCVRQHGQDMRSARSACGPQMGGWLPSWLWTPTSHPQDPKSGPFSRARSDEQSAASESQASATGTAAWELIAAHGWDLLNSGSLADLVMLGQCLAAVGGRLDALLLATNVQEQGQRQATPDNVIAGKISSGNVCC